MPSISSRPGSAQGHGRAVAPQGQRDLQSLGVFVQQAQVELHQVPADDRIRIMLGHPLVEAREQRGRVVAVMQVEVHGAAVAVCRAKHVHLALAAAFEGNTVELTALAGFDIQRHQAQWRTVVRQGLELGIAEHTLGVGLAGELHGGGNEALHEIALGWADVRLVHLNAGVAQALLHLHQLAMLAAVKAQHRALIEVTQLQGFELDARLVGQQHASMLGLRLGEERHRHLRRQAQLPRPLVGSQPELHARAFGCVMPMPGQDKALLQIHRVDLWLSVVPEVTILRFAGQPVALHVLSGQLSAVFSGSRRRTRYAAQPTPAATPSRSTATPLAQTTRHRPRSAANRR